LKKANHRPLRATALYRAKRSDVRAFGSKSEKQFLRTRFLLRTFHFPLRAANAR
jgi:hypothetical protein